TLQVNVNDLDVQNFVDRDNLFSGVDVTVSQFGNVNQTFDTIFYANKCTEWHQLGDLARYNLAQGVGACKDLPWVFLCCLERYGYTFSLHIDVEYFYSDFLANFDNL